jgi:hypothetical protein
MATLQQDVNKATSALDSACVERYLVDLHSHLLGMGNATFWIELMRDYIPSQVCDCDCDCDCDCTVSLVYMRCSDAMFSRACTRVCLEMLILLLNTGEMSF